MTDLSEESDRSDRENANRILDTLITRGAKAGAAVADEIRARILDLIPEGLPKEEFLRRARLILVRTEPIIARTLGDTLLAAWLSGGRRAVQGLPMPPRAEISPFAVNPAAYRQPETVQPVILPEEPPLEYWHQPVPEPVIRFPIIESAADDLVHRRVMTREEFDAVDLETKRSAFTVARIGSEDTIEKIRQTIEDDIATGGTLAEFRDRVEEATGGTLLSPYHIETIYRTNVANAYSNGLQKILAHPLVSDAFVYLEYHAIHDSRVRPEHLEMEKLGIQGTRIYRRDDPIWETFFPPWDYSCRCAVIPLTVDMAAADGIEEAKKYLETSVWPQPPAWVKPPPFSPPEGWSRNPSVVAIV